MYCDFILLIVGHLFVHGVILMSVYDAYFTSSVVENIEPLEWCSNPSARRVVLFVADGLRADKFFELDEKNNTRAPYLRSIIRHNGTWGVSHTRAPTESRPAHTAMLGGFWEDPNALKVGWKYNPVEFDTVFNQSRGTWSWGADDVLPFFNKGSASSHVRLDMHHYHESRLSNLDVWVFNRVKNFLKNAEQDHGLRNRLYKDRIVFFLHLAGIDSNGHRFHPQSSYYLDNIRIVDDGIREIVDVFGKFYKNDGNTAFIFTGDHGMTDEGGHGGDDPTEVKTPLVAWGSGIKHQFPPNQDPSTEYSFQEETRKWHLDPSTRMDISQIDISMLMASLIGVPYPVNSVGRIPVEYLKDDDTRKMEQIHGRTKQMLEAFLRKRSIVEENEFHLLLSQFRTNEKSIIEYQNGYIDRLIRAKKYALASNKSLKVFNFALRGFQYYQNYHTFYIFACVGSSIFGWIILSFVYALKRSRAIRETVYSSPSKNFAFLLIYVAFYIALAVRMHRFGISWRHYFYTLAPFTVWYIIFIQRQNIFTICKMVCGFRMLTAFFAAILWVCIVCMGFHNRKLFVICLTLLTFVPYFLRKESQGFMSCTVVWTTLCVCFMVFPMLPEVVKGETKKQLVLFGGILASTFCVCARIYHRRQSSPSLKRLRIFEAISAASVFLPALTSMIGYFHSYSAILSGKIIVIFSIFAPFFSSPDLFQRLMTLHVWQLSAYVLVSVSYDIVFYVIFTALLHVWLVMEYRAHEAEMKSLPFLFRKVGGVSAESKLVEKAFHDIRRAAIVIFALVIAFFGIFSVESMNQFHVRVLPFLPVTNSNALIFLFFYKLCLHYLAIGVTFCTLAALLQLPLRVTWCLIACLSDIMLLHFYFAVKNSGSWAQIGFSLANLGIAAGLPVGLLLLFGISKLMTTVRVPEMFRVL